MFVIHDRTKDHIHSPRSYVKGYVERDYKVYPKEMFAPPSEIPLIPRSDWQAIIQEQEEQQSSLEHMWRRTYGNNVRRAHLDQNGQGYCWAYSVSHTIMMARCRDNQPPKRLSAHAVACKIKNFRDQGGWCGLSAQFIRENGVPTVETWKEKSMSRQYDNPETWNEAQQYKITEDYVDLTRDVWGQNLTYDQVITCLLMNIPCALDYNWWGHSVCGVRAKWVDGQACPVIINSWQDWGEDGFAVLQGQRAIPNGAVATRGVIVN